MGLISYFMSQLKPGSGVHIKSIIQLMYWEQKILSGPVVKRTSNGLYIQVLQVLFLTEPILKVQTNHCHTLPDPLSHYTATKALAEKCVLDANSASLKTIALRPHIVLGPGDNHLVPKIIAQAKAGKLRRIGNGKNKTDISYIDNVVEAHLCAAEAIRNNPDASGKAYFISNGEPVFLWDHINILLKNAGLNPVTKSVPESAAYLFSALTGIFLQYLNDKKRTTSNPVFSTGIIKIALV